MNSESPIRNSSMFLTVACIVCGIAAGALLVPRLMHRNKLVDQTTAAGALQLNLSEFHANPQDAAVENRSTAVARQRTLFPVSADVPTLHVQNSASKTTISRGASAAQSRVPNQTAATSGVTSMTSDRNVSHWASIGTAVPQFYAPVTVHPVTVNVDNSGLIREISRVHERLDSLATEKSHPQINVVAKSEVEQSSVTPMKANSESVIQPPATRIVERLPMLDRTKPTPVPLSVPALKTPEVPAFESTLESMPAAAEPESASVPSLEFNFELVPSPQEPDSREIRPSASFQQVEEGATLESNDFSTAIFPIPVQDTINESIPRLPPIQLVPAAAPISQARGEIPTKTIRPSQVPELAMLSRPDQEASKRTTDPPFMSGRVSQVSNLPAQEKANGRTNQIQRVSHSVESSQALATQHPSSTRLKSASISTCPGCGKQCDEPKSMLQLVAPSEMFRHVRSMFQK